MAAIIDVVDNLSNGFKAIISSIMEVCDSPNDDELLNLGEDNPDRQNVAVDRFTIGTRFFDPPSYMNGELYKRLLAKSFIEVRDINLETLESMFIKWGAAFPEHGSFRQDGTVLNKEYSKGNFVVECLFIIEVIRRKTWGNNLSQDALGSSALLSKAQRDMLVNENQLPFSVLKDLYDLAFPTKAASAEGNFFKVCTKFFEEYMFVGDLSQTSAISFHGSEIKDFIDFLRKCHAPAFPRQPSTTKSSKLKAMKKATYLDKAGMKIRPFPTDTSVCSIKYQKKGMLEIPKFTINAMSEHVLRNLIAYEKRHYRNDTFIIDYVRFMDKLLDKPKDVNVLIKYGILDNHLSKAKDVSQLFHRIIKDTSSVNDRDNYYHEISESVNAFCEIPWHSWQATLRNDYCDSPWKVASTAAAIILLVLTLVQTVCSVLSTKK